MQKTERKLFVYMLFSHKYYLYLSYKKIVPE